MATHYRTQGYVLKKNDLREADQVFTVYTKDFGKIKVLGKAIRKIKSKLRSGIGLFYLSEIEFIQGKNHKTLTDALVLNKFEEIREDLESVTKIADSLDILVEEHPDEHIWDLLTEVFQKLDKKIIYHYFIWNLASILGYRIDLYNCVVCQEKLKPNKLHFSPDQGGIVCPNCYDRAERKVEVSSEVVKILRIFFKKDWNLLSRLKIKDSYLEELDSVTEELKHGIIKQ